MASGSIADIGTGFSIDNVLAYIIYNRLFFLFLFFCGSSFSHINKFA